MTVRVMISCVSAPPKRLSRISVAESSMPCITCHTSRWIRLCRRNSSSASSGSEAETERFCAGLGLLRAFRSRARNCCCLSRISRNSFVTRNDAERAASASRDVCAPV